MASGETLGMEKVTSTARLCIETAHEIYRVITASEEQNTAAVAIVDKELQNLKENGQYLLDISKRQENELQQKECKYEVEGELLSKEKRTVDIEKQNLEKKKNSLKAKQFNLVFNLDTHQKTLNDAQSSLISAKARLIDAKYILSEARSQRAAAGEGVATVITDKEVSDAQSYVDQCSSTVLNAETNLANANCALLDVNNQIQSCFESISECEAQIRVCDDKYTSLHTEIGNIKKSLALLKNAINAWGIFGNMLLDATEQTSNLKMIIQIASEINKYNLVTSNGTQIAAESFLEAWETLTMQA